MSEATDRLATDRLATDRLADVRQRIADAAKAAGRDPASVTLVAVSKTHGADRVRELLAAGQRVFGENRVQEAEGKFPALKAEFGASVGPLACFVDEMPPAVFGDVDGDGFVNGADLGLLLAS
jgi:alkanesulfonate monooxygenase SsuD/methylene tetrahydromethanopterin reductase-like flavin-dependent oxidoreductase (luciferase family)